MVFYAKTGSKSEKISKSNKNGHFGAEFKSPRNIPKATLLPRQSCFVQKTARKAPNNRKVGKMVILQRL